MLVEKGGGQEKKKFIYKGKNQIMKNERMIDLIKEKIMRIGKEE